MCSSCHSTPCLRGCPNAPELESVYICSECGTEIYEGEECYETDEGFYCESCYIECCTDENGDPIVEGEFVVVEDSSYDDWCDLEFERKREIRLWGE